jgi:RNA polymerase sigma-70 factor (ECF subfamily)
MITLDDNTCIERTLAGDVEAFSTLVERYRSLVFAVTLKILRNRHDAEDLAQESFVKAFCSLSSFKREAKFSTWLCQIAYNTAVSHTRKKRPDKAGADILPNDFVDEYEPSEERSEMQTLLKRALSQLSPEDELLINLYYQYDNSVDEIASITGLTGSNVKVRLHRIRKNIKLRIKN